MTEIALVPSAVAGAALAAELIAEALAQREDAVLGVAAGSTPLGMWAQLRDHGVDVASTPAFALDEYVGLLTDHPESYRAKSDAVKRTVEGPLSSSCPGSAIQLHPHAIVIVDEEAGASLEHRDYDRFAGEHRALESIQAPA